MKRALIQGTRICDVVDPGQEFEVAPDLKWVDVPDDVDPVVDTYTDQYVKFVPPVPTKQELAMAEINRLESLITKRRIREMATPEGQQWMIDLEAQIAIQRAKL